MEDEQNADELLTVQDASKELEVLEGTVRRALSEKRLPFTVQYGRKLIRRSDLEAYKSRTRPDGKKPIGRPSKNPGASND